MPDSMETSYNQWVGRKETSLRRPVLDCGHRNRPDREVHFHIWCDRLSCSPACAAAEHDCGLFKGSKSGIEEEAVPVEAAVEPAAAWTQNSPRTRPPFTLPRDDWDALYGVPEQLGVALTTASAGETVTVAITNPGEPVSWSDVVDTYQRIMDDPHYRLSRFVPEGARVTMMTEDEAAGFRAQQHLSLECSRSRPLCSGCDGLAMDSFPCVHDCHEPAACSCPVVDVSTFADDPAMRRVVPGYDPGCRVCPAPYAPPVDAAPEPDPRTCPTCGEATEPGAGPCDGCRDWTGVQLERWRAEAEDRPWWRRMLPGGSP